MSNVAKDLDEVALSHTDSGGLIWHNRFGKMSMTGFLLGLESHILYVTRVAHSWNRNHTRIKSKNVYSSFYSHNSYHDTTPGFYY